MAELKLKIVKDLMPVLELPDEYFPLGDANKFRG